MEEMVLGWVNENRGLGSGKRGWVGRGAGRDLGRKVWLEGWKRWEGIGWED